MGPRIALTALLLAAGCAASHPPPTPVVDRGETGVFRGAEMARVRCLVVAPFENASSAPLAADAATAALLSGVAATGTRVFPVKDLRAIFRDTPFELPEGVPPGLAMELAQLVGADAAVYGTIEGAAAGGGLLVSVRLALSPARELLYASTFAVKAAPGEKVEAAVRRILADETHEMFVRLGGFRGGACFDRKRLDALRELALAEEAPRAAPAPPPPPPPKVAAPAPAPAPTAPPPAPRPVPVTQRQRDWVRLLQDRQPFRVDDVAFAGRSAQFQRDGGLADLAIAAAAAPEVRIAVEGHVDATHDAPEDTRLSLAMAQAAVDRLVELGVPRNRLQVVARGSEAPRLPNFTARGRATNRRIEAVGQR